ncbi:hypothetical protein [Streptomyces sp. NPDC049555]|uniref:hypothetical protein n=1 Tax=Streptomyces sp. NPDC049555 TaxID=3154930 RepID=UPI003417C082
MTTAVTPDGPEREQPSTAAQLSLGTAAARNLATTTGSVPQMQDISSRWLLRTLPWVEAADGTYRVDRRLVCTVGDGRVTFVQQGAAVSVGPAELGELPLLRGFADDEVAGRSEPLRAHVRARRAEGGRPQNRRGEADIALSSGHTGEPTLPGTFVDYELAPREYQGTTSILAMRTGEDAEGVIGLRRTGIPDEYEPGLNARFMGISNQAIMSYLVSTYYSAAVLVPDALGVLENVEVGCPTGG